MLLWFTDLMDVTEEVTIHRPNVLTLLTSAFISGDLKVATRRGDLKRCSQRSFYRILRFGENMGLFALREILFVLQKNLSTRNHFQCERFFSSTKILSSVTKLQRHRRVALEAYNFLSSEKIYCSVTATLQRVIIFRNRYHTKWYCARDPIYCHLPPFRNG